MKYEALTHLCAENFERREHCCFGISPFNSYFSEERIRELAAWGKREFKSMHFFVPDVPAAYTLQAQGYTAEKAEWKARRQSQYLKNKIRKALISISIPEEEISSMILDWERLTATQRYNGLLDEVTGLFEEDEQFRSACLGASRWVLTQKTSNLEEFSEDALRTAVRYFLSELPLFADTAGIVGAETSVFCYHQRVDFLQNFFERKLSYSPASGQGFLILKPLFEDASLVDPSKSQSESPVRPGM